MTHQSVPIGIVVVLPLLLLLPVNSQIPSNSQVQPIINTKTLKVPGTFTITCDINRVQLPTEDSGITKISGLTISVNTSNSAVTKVAQYFPSENFKFEKVPEGRKWIMSFTGGNETNNRNTTRIDVLIADSKCTDAGTYFCIVQYFSVVNGFNTVNGTQDVTAEADTSVPVLSLSPLNSDENGWTNFSRYELNENITMTCRVNGPASLVIKWQREVRPRRGDISFEAYPVENDITNSPTTQTGSGACTQFQYQSQLKFSVSENDNNRIYLCVVQVNGEDTFTTSATIDITLGATTNSPGSGAASAGGNKGDIGMIIGIVIGSIAAVIIIAIIIGVICYRRSKKDKSKDYTDTSNGGTTYPTYPTVNSRTPYESNNPDRSSKFPRGNVNRGLDTSFDNTNKGPPVYTINNNTESSPPRNYNNRYVNSSFDADKDSYDHKPPPIAPKPQNNDKPRVRRYSTDDGTDDNAFYLGNENMGTNV